MLQRETSPWRHPTRRACSGCAVLASLLLPLAAMGGGKDGAIDRIRQAGKVTLGYRIDARPFAYRDESGNPAGYSVELCRKIVDELKAELKLPALAVSWVPVKLEDRFRAVQDGRIDVLCGADTATLSRRKEVAFSISIFPGGIGALLRADSPDQLRQALGEGPAPTTKPLWRASPAQILGERTFSVVGATTSAAWLASRLQKFKVSAKVDTVTDYDSGVRKVLDRQSDVLFGDRAILLDAARRSPQAGDLIVLDRLFTYEPIALAVARGEEDLRLVVDRALSRPVGSPEFRDLYVKYFGVPNETSVAFFRTSALPD